MIKNFSLIVIAALALSAPAVAEDLPKYYPDEGFQRVGVLDAVQLEQQQIVIGDIPYSLSDNVIVHSRTSYSVPSSRLRVGSTIGYRFSRQGRLITEIWLLPNNYQDRARR